MTPSFNEIGWLHLCSDPADRQNHRTNDRQSHWSHNRRLGGANNGPNGRHAVIYRRQVVRWWPAVDGRTGRCRRTVQRDLWLRRASRPRPAGWRQQSSLLAVPRTPDIPAAGPTSCSIQVWHRQFVLTLTAEIPAWKKTHVSMCPCHPWLGWRLLGIVKAGIFFTVGVFFRRVFPRLGLGVCAT